MKPWLLEILACPMDKSYPLDAHFLSWETDEAEFDRFLEEYEGRTVEGEAAGIVKFEREGGEALLVSDEMTREPTPPAQYLEQLSVKLDELKPIRDHTGSSSAKILELLRGPAGDVLRGAVESSASVTSEAQFAEFLPELVLLNRYKLFVEVDEGLLSCPACRRWYPIIETIPQMLPDALRDRKEDLAFLARWSSVDFGDIRR
ncbi:MAG: hypothetical protein Kow0069_18530 [Promethearchaeota archaeon]